MNQEISSTTNLRLKRLFVLGFFSSFILFFLLGILLQKLPFNTALISAFVGSLIGVSFYFLFMRWFLHGRAKEIEIEFEAVDVSGALYDDFVEVGKSIFQTTSGKIFLTKELLVFKPSKYNGRGFQGFTEISLKDIEKVDKEKSLFGHDRVFIRVEGINIIIQPFGNADLLQNKIQQLLNSDK